jgi:serine/threonine protein kinase
VLILLLLLLCCSVKLCDFGCARAWQTKAVPERKLARFATFAGTPAYMSPQASPQVAFMNTSSMQEQQQQQHQPATPAAAATALELSTAQSTSLQEPTGKSS